MKGLPDAVLWLKKQTKHGRQFTYLVNGVDAGFLVLEHTQKPPVLLVLTPRSPSPRWNGRSGVWFWVFFKKTVLLCFSLSCYLPPSSTIGPCKLCVVHSCAQAPMCACLCHCVCVCVCVYACVCVGGGGGRLCVWALNGLSWQDFHIVNTLLFITSTNNAQLINSQTLPTLC